MTQVTAKKSYIKDKDGNYIIPYVNPADEDNFGVVKPDGETITVNSGVISANISKDFINNSKALLTGAVSNNADIYNNIYYYNHSTFDLSKFSVTGTPTITDDGIVSGFSSSNYLTISNNVINKLINATNFNFIFRFKTENSLGSGGLVLGYNNAISGGTFSLWVSASSVAPIVFLNESGTATLKSIGNLTKTINTNTEYEAYFSKNGNNYGFGIRELNEENYTQSAGITDVNSIYSNKQTIGRNNILTSIDLKQFSITVDGVEVFSGNKQGIDTIKPDDFATSTSPNEPTISADGILTTTSTNQWIKKNIDFSLANNWTFEIGCKIKDNLAGTELILGTCILSSQASQTNVLCRGLNSSNTLAIFALIVIPSSYNNKNINVIWQYDKTNGLRAGYKLYSDIDYIWGNWNTSMADVSSSWLYEQLTGASDLVEYDLNAVKYYENGDLVYQSCLKIPYTLSKTGSKVVDVYARPRVQDMYEQFGYAPYYTIDEANENFTLPMGEVYGMIQKVNDYYKTNVTSMIMPDYANGISVTANTDYTVPSDGWVNVMSNNNAGHLFINGVDLGYVNLNASNNDASYAIYPVAKGDIVKLTAGTITFYPSKGV